MEQGSLGASIIGNVNPDKKQIKFDAVFSESIPETPIIAKAMSWNIESIEDLNESIVYNPPAVGCTINSKTGLLKYDQPYNDNPTHTPRDAVIRISCKPYSYGLVLRRYYLYYSFRLYDFDSTPAPT